jgi:5-methyltetrahydropteroyltriglutamate--homocysteine methyltransferase
LAAKSAGVVEGPIGEGSLHLSDDCELAAGAAAGLFKFMITSPYMPARTLLDRCYGDFDALWTTISDVLAAQVAALPCDCLWIDEANMALAKSRGPYQGRA